MSDWKDKSDFEINEAVYNKKYGEPKSEFAHFFSALPKPNYCNNPSDAWSIIIKNKISISPQVNGDEWEATQGIDKDLQPSFSEWGKNPLRAAMIVYLEMNGVKP